MTKGIISGGVCGLITVVEAHKRGNGRIKLTISSNCENIKKLAAEMDEIDPYDEIFRTLKLTRTCDVASQHLPHPSCIVPSGILKTIEVEADLALPQEASIKIEKLY
ncbi:MAG: hypothetical protein KJ737_07525 [Proteobacteria bacterium]|nr:hypothetical protein [Pseudomonadota bacterium]